MARIFIAIRFNSEFKQKLIEVQDTLKAKGIKGNYCSCDNLHITLAFIGEQYDLPTIRKVVKEVQFEPFNLVLGKLGTFPTKAGIIWCGIKECSQVKDLTNELRKRLKENNVSFREIDFFPHISLVQHPSSIITDVVVPNTTIRIDTIHIMKSERIDGVLVYSEI